MSRADYEAVMEQERHKLRTAETLDELQAALARITSLHEAERAAAKRELALG